MKTIESQSKGPFLRSLQHSVKYYQEDPHSEILGASW